MAGHWLDSLHYVGKPRRRKDRVVSERVPTDKEIHKLQFVADKAAHIVMMNAFRWHEQPELYADALHDSVLEFQRRNKTLEDAIEKATGVGIR